MITCNLLKYIILKIVYIIAIVMVDKFQSNIRKIFSKYFYNIRKYYVMHIRGNASLKIFIEHYAREKEGKRTFRKMHIKSTFREMFITYWEIYSRAIIVSSAITRLCSLFL